MIEVLNVMVFTVLKTTTSATYVRLEECGTFNGSYRSCAIPTVLTLKVLLCPREQPSIMSSEFKCWQEVLALGSWWELPMIFLCKGQAVLFMLDRHCDLSLAYLKIGFCAILSLRFFSANTDRLVNTLKKTYI